MVNYLGASFIKENNFCEEIYNIAVGTANKYLQNHSEDIIENEIVSFFLQESYHNPMRYVSSGELKTKIISKGFSLSDPISAIARLRSKGVFLVSPKGQKGYKFPCNEHEIAEYFDRISNNVIPQLQRANTLHKILVEQSSEGYNILKRDEFDTLSRLITDAAHDSLNKH